LEKSRILSSAAGWLIAAALAITASAQTTAPDSLRRDDAAVDTLQQPSETAPDTAASEIRSQDEIIKELKAKSAAAVREKTAQDTSEVAAVVDTSLYEASRFLARGPADEIKSDTKVIVVTHGAVGTPKIPVEYLNVAGSDITVNGLPFIFNGVYRPYLVGTDINTIPWEILKEINTDRGRLDFSIGMPYFESAASDVEIARGPYGYAGSRWRFFQPVGNKTKAYFTVGFKKSDSYYYNNDYDGFHVTGGIKRKLYGGELEIDLWKHRAKSGLLSFDYLVAPVDRQSRGVDRREITYFRSFSIPLTAAVKSYYHRSAQTLTGFAAEMKLKNDLAGVCLDLIYKLDKLDFTYRGEYHNLRLYGIDGATPTSDIFRQRFGISSDSGLISYDLAAGFEWDKRDGAVVTPSLNLKYNINGGLYSSMSAFRERRFPDLQLAYFNDNVVNLGYTDNLETYSFQSNSRLKSPVTSAAAFRIGLIKGGFDIYAAVAINDIKDQIRIAYSDIASGDITATPVNFDDRYLRTTVGVSRESGLITGELSASYRKWNDKYFPDGLEKGPAFVGFGQLELERQFFISELYLGASLEIRAESRRDFRSIQLGFVDSYALLNSRLMFRYKDFTFYLNEDNILSQEYYPLYPYPGSPRMLWWNFRWRFFG